jgi:hypothetical protein
MDSESTKSSRSRRFPINPSYPLSSTKISRKSSRRTNHRNRLQQLEDDGSRLSRIWDQQHDREVVARLALVNLLALIGR